MKDDGRLDVSYRVALWNLLRPRRKYLHQECPNHFPHIRPWRVPRITLPFTSRIHYLCELVRLEGFWNPWKIWVTGFQYGILRFTSTRFLVPFIFIPLFFIIYKFTLLFIILLFINLFIIYFNPSLLTL